MKLRNIQDNLIEWKIVVRVKWKEIKNNHYKEKSSFYIYR